MSSEKFEITNSIPQYDEIFINTNNIRVQTQDYELSDLQKTQECEPTNNSDYRVAFSQQPKSYCVGCVDIVDSTKISSRLSQKDLSTYYEKFLNSLSEIITKFQGKVIKNIGDCLLFYFPESVDPNAGGIKKAIECGIKMIKFQEELSYEMIALGLPALNYRVSTDYGSVLIMNTSNSPLVDLIGPSVNTCVKINHFAKKNEFVIGGDLEQIVKKFKEYQIQQINSFSIGLRQVYPVYSVKHQKRYR